MRLIDADALKEKAIHYSETEYHFDHEAVDVNDIDDAPTLPSLRWERCKDRLPEPDTDIVFIAKYGDTYETDIGSMSKDMKWYGYECWHQNKNVIYWMPLPEPPKEDA